MGKLRLRGIVTQGHTAHKQRSQVKLRSSSVTVSVMWTVMLTGKWRLTSTCPAARPQGHISPGGAFTCIKVLCRLAVVVSTCTPSPPFTAAPRVSKLVERQSQWERQEVPREGPRKTLFEA